MLDLHQLPYLQRPILIEGRLTSHMRGEPELSISQMRKLVMIAEAKSLSRAAVALSMTQPGLSRFTKDIEEKFRTKLFHRTGRGVQVTAAGDRLLQAINPMLSAYDAACLEISYMAQTVEGEIAFAMFDSTNRVIGVPLIKRFKSMHPKAAIRVLRGNSHAIQEMIVSGRADFGIVCDTHSLPGLDLDPLVVEELYLIARAGALDPAREEVPLSKLSDAPLFLPAKGGSIRTILGRSFAELGLNLNLALDVDDNESILDLVAEGQGYTVLPFSGIYRELATGRFSIARIVSPSLQRVLMLAAPSNRQISFAARQAASLARTIVKGSSDLARWKPL